MNSAITENYFPSSLSGKEAALAVVEREFLPKHFYDYAKAAWHLIEPAVELVDSWYVGAICEHLQAVSEGQIKKLIINVPPRTLKSSLVSVLWPTWEWAREPSLRAGSSP